MFTFDDEDIQEYSYSGVNDKIQYSDDDCLIIGGSDNPDKGAAIYVGNDFFKGRSCECETFGSSTLSRDVDFTIKCLEVWGFDFI